MKRLVVLVMAVLVLGACSGDDPGQEAAENLVVENSSFGEVPGVAPGDTLVIDNRDAAAHTFTSSDGAWQEVALAPNSTSVFTVPSDLAPGDYRFVCTIHAGMGGTLTVGG